MIRSLSISHKKIWENFVLSQKDANFLHSWDWGEVQKKLGFKAIRLGFYNIGILEGIALLIIRRARRGNYLECPAGPLLNWDNKSVFKEFLEQIKAIGKKEKCIFARVRPQLLSTEFNKVLFKKYGFIKAPMHLHAQTTWQLDLDKNEEELLKTMRKTTRYLIRRAKKYGVIILQSNDIKDIDVLYNLQLQTALRHKFVPFSKKYLLTEFEVFSANKECLLFKAVYKKKILALAMIIFYHKEAIYHYSGSTSEFSKIPASYLLQWEAINEARKRNCLLYNFWGITDSNNPKHRFYGVTTFKKGFGGWQKNYLPAQDYPLKLRYWTVYLFETIRKIFRHL